MKKQKMVKKESKTVKNESFSPKQGMLGAF